MPLPLPLLSLCRLSVSLLRPRPLGLDAAQAHSHLLAMLLGSSEAIPIHNGKSVLGQWQSVLLVDLDGPRDRTVGIQITGFK